MSCKEICISRRSHSGSPNRAIHTFHIVCHSSNRMTQCSNLYMLVCLIDGIWNAVILFMPNLATARRGFIMKGLHSLHELVRTSFRSHAFQHQIRFRAFCKYLMALAKVECWAERKCNLICQRRVDHVDSVMIGLAEKKVMCSFSQLSKVLKVVYRVG